MPLRVLLADDCADTRSAFRILLELWGHEVREAADGAAALREAATFMPHAALVDLALPGGPDGYEVARRLRRLPGLGGVCLFALSRLGRPGDREAARQAGYDRVLLKPVEPDELEKMLAAVEAGTLTCGMPPGQGDSSE
jgi:CheY-like chemotaxis protein